MAVSRLKREGKLDDDGEDEARAVLDRLADEWREVEPTDELRILAAILSKRYPLKAADVLQLAASLQWCDETRRTRASYAWTTDCVPLRLPQASVSFPNALPPR